YPTVKRILVYPSAFQPKRVLPSRYMGVVTGPVAESGEAWRDGIVVLSWDDVHRGGANPADGDDVVLHEFAHALDQEDGAAGGTHCSSSRAEHPDRRQDDAYSGLRDLGHGRVRPGRQFAPLEPGSEVRRNLGGSLVSELDRHRHAVPHRGPRGRGRDTALDAAVHRGAGTARS